MSQPSVGSFSATFQGKLHMVAKQCNEQLRLSFISDCEIYSPEMMVFVDETGSTRSLDMP